MFSFHNRRNTCFRFITGCLFLFVCFLFRNTQQVEKTTAVSPAAAAAKAAKRREEMAAVAGRKRESGMSTVRRTAAPPPPAGHGAVRVVTNEVSVLDNGMRYDSKVTRVCLAGWLLGCLGAWLRMCAIKRDLVREHRHLLRVTIAITIASARNTDAVYARAHGF